MHSTFFNKINHQETPTSALCPNTDKEKTGPIVTCLGMAISRLLANAMGGDILVESELNVGSTFTVTIPSVIVEEIPEYLKEEQAESARAVRLSVSGRLTAGSISLPA